MDRRPVEMVRLEREEETFDREEMLGRDASSVFPNESKAQALAEVEELKKAVGGSRFISETQLEEIREQGLSGRPETGQNLSDKPLAEVLAENKRKKEEEFQEKWRKMKQGKNRPLDPDEFEFVESLRQQQAGDLRKMLNEEQEELDTFRNAVQLARDLDSAEKPIGPCLPPPEPATKPVTKPVTKKSLGLRKASEFKPVVRVKVVRKVDDGSETGPDRKRLKGTDSGSDVEAAGGLGGLLGDYSTEDSSS